MYTYKNTSEQLIDTWNEEVIDLDGSEVLRWASRKFEGGLYCLSSFGVDSAVTLDLLKRSNVSLPVLYIDTGFLFPETHEYRERLINEFDIEVVVAARPSQETIQEIGRLSLWEYDIDEYSRLTKLEPLEKAVKQLGIRALISGVRKDQTPNRASLRIVESGIYNETRVHPILHWNQKHINEYIEENELPRHPLHARGYASIGDWTTTLPGRTRKESRTKLGANTECGLHLSPSREARKV